MDINPLETLAAQIRLTKALAKDRLLLEWGEAPAMLTTTGLKAFADLRVVQLAAVADGSAFEHERQHKLELDPRTPWKAHGTDESMYMWGAETLQALPGLQTELGVPPLAVNALYEVKSTEKGMGSKCFYDGLSLGHNGSGLAWHQHEGVFNQVVFGRKRWWLSKRFPPGGINPMLPTAQWARDVWLTLQRSARISKHVHECTAGPGDLLYIPDGWYHQTLNIGQVVAVTIGCKNLVRQAAIQARLQQCRDQTNLTADNVNVSLPLSPHWMKIAAAKQQRQATKYKHNPNVLGETAGALRSFEYIKTRIKNTAKGRANSSCLISPRSDFTTRITETRGSIAVLKDALTAYPDDAIFRLQLGTALIDSGNLEQAIGALKLALAMNPVHYEIHSELARANAMAGHFKEAIRWAKTGSNYTQTT
jgi:hypothetical protein